MDKINNYDIPFSGLKIGSHRYDFNINKEFFDLFDVEQEFSDCNLTAEVDFIKGSSLFELNFKIKGTITVPCDVTNENFDLKIKNKWKLLVKFSDHFDDSDDEVITLPIGESLINVSQNLYEGIILVIPIRKVNPNCKETEKYKEIQQLLDKMKPKNNFEVESNQEIEFDPRWEKLKNLKNLN